MQACDTYARQPRSTVRAVLVQQHGNRIWERRYPHQDRDLHWGSGTAAPLFGEHYRVAHTPSARQNVKSVTKSVLSLLVGIAHERGLFDLDRPVAVYLPEVMSLARDERAATITPRHLLQMSSGFEWIENGEVTLRWINSPEPLAFTAQQPMVADPGSQYRYSTADTHLLSVCLSSVLPTDLLDWANDALFGPLGFRADQWLRDNSGNPIGGSELFLSAREMATIGQLVLDDGRHDGRQLVGREWIELTTAPQSFDPDLLAPRDPLTGQLVQSPPGVRLHRDGYGWLWWLTDFHGIPAVMAQGYGGQLIVVLRKLEAVVVIQRATNPPPDDEPDLPAEEMLDEFIVPTLLAR